MAWVRREEVRLLRDLVRAALTQNRLIQDERASLESVERRRPDHSYVLGARSRSVLLEMELELTLVPGWVFRSALAKAGRMEESKVPAAPD
jgi:hypothetical protein